MNTFKVTAIRTDEYEISLDPEIINEHWLHGFSEVFHKVESMQDVVEDIAFKVLRFGADQFHEGYGYLKRINKLNEVIPTLGSRFRILDEAEYATGIVLKLITEDDEHEFIVQEKES